MPDVGARLWIAVDWEEKREETLPQKVPSLSGSGTDGDFVPADYETGELSHGLRDRQRNGGTSLAIVSSLPTDQPVLGINLETPLLLTWAMRYTRARLVARPQY